MTDLRRHERNERTGEFVKMRTDLESGEDTFDGDVEKDFDEFESAIPDPKYMAAVGALTIVLLTGLLWYTKHLDPVLQDAKTKGSELLYILGVLLLFIGIPLRAFEAKMHGALSVSIPKATKKLKGHVTQEVRAIPAGIASEIHKVPTEIIPKIRREMEVVPTEVASKVMSEVGEVEKRFTIDLRDAEARLQATIDEMPKEIKKMLSAHIDEVGGSLEKHLELHGKKKQGCGFGL
jgi:hypothetical protein